jgi:hypothetical protein
MYSYLESDSAVWVKPIWKHDVPIGAFRRVSFRTVEGVRVVCTDALLSQSTGSFLLWQQGRFMVADTIRKEVLMAVLLEDRGFDNVFFQMQNSGNYVPIAREVFKKYNGWQSLTIEFIKLFGELGFSCLHQNFCAGIKKEPQWEDHPIDVWRMLLGKRKSEEYADLFQKPLKAKSLAQFLERYFGFYDGDVFEVVPQDFYLVVDTETGESLKPIWYRNQDSSIEPLRCRFQGKKGTWNLKIGPVVMFEGSGNCVPVIMTQFKQPVELCSKSLSKESRRVSFCNVTVPMAELGSKRKTVDSSLALRTSQPPCISMAQLSLKGKTIDSSLMLQASQSHHLPTSLEDVFFQVDPLPDEDVSKECKFLGDSGLDEVPDLVDVKAFKSSDMEVPRKIVRESWLALKSSNSVKQVLSQLDESIFEKHDETFLEEPYWVPVFRRVCLKSEVCVPNMPDEELWLQESVQVQRNSPYKQILLRPKAEVYLRAKDSRGREWLLLHGCLSCGAPTQEAAQWAYKSSFRTLTLVDGSWKIWMTLIKSEIFLEDENQHLGFHAEYPQEQTQVEGELVGSCGKFLMFVQDTAFQLEYLKTLKLPGSVLEVIDCGRSREVVDREVISFYLNPCIGVIEIDGVLQFRIPDKGREYFEVGYLIYLRMYPKLMWFVLKHLLLLAQQDYTLGPLILSRVLVSFSKPTAIAYMCLIATKLLLKLSLYCDLHVSQEPVFKILKFGGHL